VIHRRTIALLGVSQLLCWGLSFYMIGVFGDRIVADRGWSRTVVFGGFSAALVVMGLASPVIGRAIDRFGGGPVMAAGSVLTAIGCASIAVATSIPGYYIAWICLGVAMRATLYDAAFAALARIGGVEAQRPMAQVTLLGGLASTVFWPAGHALADAVGWRTALVVYAAIALATVPLHLAIRGASHSKGALANDSMKSTKPPAHPRRLREAAILYALFVTLINSLNAGLSAHMIGILSDLGLAAALAVSIAALRGVGQTTARIVQVAFGGRLPPADLNLIAVAILPFCIALCLAAAGHPVAATVFAFFYGAGNGIVSITRGTLPLVLFNTAGYGALVGKLLIPSFIASAAAPLAFASVIDHFGGRGALLLAIVLSSLTLATAFALKRLAKPANG